MKPVERGVRRVLSLATSLALIWVASIAPRAGAQSFTFQNPTPEEGDQAGTSVATSGNLVLVGVPYDNTGATASGSVYLFDAITGALLRTINNPNPSAWAQFGTSVAISGDHVLVGAPYDDTGANAAGVVHLFSAATGALLRTIDNPTPEDGEGFGLSVAIEGDTILVGASGDKVSGVSAGGAYLFSAVSGATLWAFHRPAPKPFDSFGSAVAIAGNRALVGARYASIDSIRAGAAYLFDVDTGSLVRTFDNPTPANGDNFGSAVALSASYVLVGAPEDDADATKERSARQDAGAAYLFDSATGALRWTFASPEPGSQDYFGLSVAVSGDSVVIGSPGARTADRTSGKAYLLAAATGTLIHTFTNPVWEEWGYYGGAVAISGSSVLVGAPGDSAAQAFAGVAYLHGYTYYNAVEEWTHYD